jgi:hypothetical protein
MARQATIYCFGMNSRQSDARLGPLAVEMVVAGAAPMRDITGFRLSKRKICGKGE